MSEINQQSELINQMQPKISDEKSKMTTISQRLLYIVMENDPDEPHPKSKLAKICGISQSAVYQWFRGGTIDPKGIHVGAVCRYYKSDSLWALLGDQRDIIPTDDETVQPTPDESKEKENALGKSQQASSPAAQLSLVE